MVSGSDSRMFTEPESLMLHRSAQLCEASLCCSNILQFMNQLQRVSRTDVCCWLFVSRIRMRVPSFLCKDLGSESEFDRSSATSGSLFSALWNGWLDHTGMSSPHGIRLRGAHPPADHHLWSSKDPGPRAQSLRLALNNGEGAVHLSASQVCEHKRCNRLTWRIKCCCHLNLGYGAMWLTKLCFRESFPVSNYFVSKLLLACYQLGKKIS